MTNLHKRAQLAILKPNLARYPVVILQGARGTGKTSLVRSPWLAGDRHHVALDDLDTRARATEDPAALWQEHTEITLDEVQRQPDLLATIEAEAARDPQPGRFLLTSTHELRRPQRDHSANTAYIHLPPLTWAEIELVPAGRCLEALLAAETAADCLDALGPNRPDPARPLTDAILHGGHPEPALASDLTFRDPWCGEHLRTYLETDLPAWAAVTDPLGFHRVMRWLAARPGQLANVSLLARETGITEPTARRYLAHLAATFQIVTVPALGPDRGRGGRLVRAGRVFWADTGIATHLARCDDPASSRPWLTAWVATQLVTWSHVRRPHVEILHWRTHRGQAVDLVIATPQRLVPVVITATTAARPRDLASVETFLKLHREAPFGAVVCRCAEAHEASANIIAIPVEQLLLG